MTILSKNAFHVDKAKTVQIPSPGTTGKPATEGVDLAVTVTPQEAKAQGVTLPDKFVVVAHLPDEREPGGWRRFTLQGLPPEQVGYRGSVTVNHFIASGVPVDTQLALQMGIWFSVEQAPKVHVEQGANSLKIDSTPGDTVAWGQAWGHNVKPSTK